MAPFFREYSHRRTYFSGKSGNFFIAIELNLGAAFLEFKNG